MKANSRIEEFSAVISKPLAHTIARKTAIFLALLAFSVPAGCSYLPSAGPTAAEIRDGEAHDNKLGFKIVDVTGPVLDVLAREPRSAALSLPIESKAPDVDRIAVGDILSVSVFEAGPGLFSSRSLARGQTGKARRCRLPQSRQLGRIPGVFQGALDAGEQFVSADRLFDEIRSPGLHGLDRHRHVALAGDHNCRQPSSLALKPPQQRQPTYAGHLGIDQEATFATRTIGLEE